MQRRTGGVYERNGACLPQYVSICVGVKAGTEAEGSRQLVEEGWHKELQRGWKVREGAGKESDSVRYRREYFCFVLRDMSGIPRP